MNDAIEFQPIPERFYSMVAIEHHLGGAMTLKTFLAIHGLERTGKDRLCQSGLWGYEILQAMRRRADALTGEYPGELNSDVQEPAALPVKRKRGRPKKDEPPRNRITAADIGLDRRGSTK